MLCSRRRLRRGAPLFQNRFQRVLLGPVHHLAAFPRYGLDQLDDRLLNAVAQLVGVEGVEFPTAVAVSADEPLVARVSALVGRGERQQPVQMFWREGNAPYRDVITSIIGEPSRQVVF